MRATLKKMMAAVVFAGATLAMAASLPANAEQFDEVKLTQADIDRYIVVQKGLQKLSDKPPQTKAEEEQLQKQLEDITKRGGFVSYERFDAVAQTIALVMSGIDPETGVFKEPKIAIQEEIAGLKADPDVPKDEKARLLRDLQEALRTTPPLKFKANGALVKKNIKKLEAVLN
ncbi:MAG: hypothetical protein AAFR04_12475 [Pseudomonadota bacterium]